MMQGMPPPPRRRKVGWTKPSTKLWQRRYDRLRSEGFDHNEAARLATGVVGSKAMLKGRKSRKKWYNDLLSKGFTAAEIEESIDDMYDKFDWIDPWTQFYPEEGEGMSDEE